MKKADLVEALYKGANLPTKKQAGDIVEWFFDTITSALKKEGLVDIAGFGKFVAVKRAARKVRNPKTGETMTAPAKTVPKFKPSMALKEAVK